MFQSPVDTATSWNYEMEQMQVPVFNIFRYPGYGIHGVHIVNQGTTDTLKVPVKSYVRSQVDGTNTWIELEPLLVNNLELARKFANRFPTIYIKIPEVITTISEGVYNAGDPLDTVHEFSMAIQNTDRLERDVAHSFALIGSAMQDLVDTTSWNSFSQQVQALDDIFLLDANGFRVTTTTELIFETGGASETISFDPATMSLKNMINGRVGTLSLSAPRGTDAQPRYLWVTTNVAFQPTVQFEKAAIHADTRIIMMVDLFNWFAPQSVTGVPNTLPRFTTGNELKYFVNGPAFYKDLFSQIQAAAATGDDTFKALFLAGYAIFQDTKFVYNTDASPATLLDAAKSLVSKGGQCYFLPLQFCETSGAGGSSVSSDEVVAIAAMIVMILAEVGLALQIGSKGLNNTGVGIVMPIPVIVAGVVMVLATTMLESDFLVDKIRQAGSKVADIDFENPGGGRSRKIWALHPAYWDDNPHQGSNAVFLVNIARAFLRGVSAYHQKIAVVHNTEWIGYCGGIDLNPNRMDDEKHLSATPYHDVHASVKGPAAADIASTFIDRWNDENRKQMALGHPDDGIDITQMNLPVPPPTPQNTGDIVQVARTNFQANPTTGGGRALRYAPSGDRTILNTLLAAINNAKEYIYIEDQYFTPPLEFREALLGAIDRGLKSLVIVMPGAPDQPYGETQRALFVDQLLEKNTDSLNPVVRIGFPRRQYILPSTTTEKLVGRLKTGQDMHAADNTIMLGPISRIPDAPFWISVEGEMMLVTGNVPGSPDIDPVVGGVLTPGMDDSYPKYKQYNVERSKETNFYDFQQGCVTQDHKAGTPATVVIASDIYVHAKCMMVDDMFLSIGSANLNRRGFYSDSEANVFSIPSSLRFASPNPVRELRKQLWSEHLNLPLSIGQVLLDDPVNSSRLFDRRGDTGNRFIPYRAVSTKVKSLLNKVGDITLDATSVSGLTVFKDAVSALLLATEFFDFDELFFHASDPSSYLENPLEPI